MIFYIACDMIIYIREITLLIHKKGSHHDKKKKSFKNRIDPHNQSSILKANSKVESIKLYGGRKPLPLVSYHDEM